MPLQLAASTSSSERLHTPAKAPAERSRSPSGPGAGRPHRATGPLPWLSRALAAHAVCGVVAAPIERLLPLVAGAVCSAGLLAAIGAVLVAGAVGLLGATLGGDAVIGVTRTPVTSPLIAFFCFVDDVGIGPHSDPAPRYRLRSGKP